MNKNEILELLQKHKIDLSKWGLGGAKTVNHLIKDVTTRELNLVSQDDGTLLSWALGAVVMVYYTNDGRILKLKEEKQVFKDGREKVRNLNTSLGSSSVGEKMQPGELSIEAAKRAISEELGIKEEVSLVYRKTFVKGPKPSVSYPGLMTKYIMDIYELFLPTHLYKPEGYIEKQADKTSYFVWVEV